jgi:HEAT repeats
VMTVALVYGRAQELQGRFYAEKDSYILGEPVIFNVEITDTGKDIAYVNAKNPSKCLDTYEFSILGSGPPCVAHWIPECQDEEAALNPGESYKGQWPLENWYQFEKEGKYDVTATRHIPVRTNNGDIKDFSFSSRFQVNIKPADPIIVQNTLQEFEQKLHSPDPEVRHSALDVLATTAPVYFEATALRLSRNEDPFVVLHAVEALGRLDTPEARAALADIISPGKSPNESEPDGKPSDFGVARIRAIEALGRTADTTYLPEIERYVDDPNEYVQLIALVSIAELGKSEAISQLQGLFFSDNAVTRKNVAYALRYSLAPEAVDSLINAIPDKAPQVRERVITSLHELTGQTFPGNALTSKDSEDLQNKWRIWWKTHKDTFAAPKLQFLCRMN